MLAPSIAMKYLLKYGLGYDFRITTKHLGHPDGFVQVKDDKVVDFSIHYMSGVFKIKGDLGTDNHNQNIEREFDSVERLQDFLRDKLNR